MVKNVIMVQPKIIDSVGLTFRKFLPLKNVILFYLHLFQEFFFTVPRDRWFLNSFPDQG